MDAIRLLASTSNACVDDVLCGTIGIFELLFPGRVRGYYVEGSYADATGLSTSDLDLAIVFKERFTSAAEAERATQACAGCAALAAVEFDAAIVDEAELEHEAWPALKLASLLVFGEDIRERLDLRLDAWTRDRMHSSYWRLDGLFGRPGRGAGAVRLPLAYPDPAGEFLGYVGEGRRTLRLGDGTSVPTTRDLIRATGWAATARVASEAGQFVARKCDCVRLYRKYIGDEWAPLLEDIYASCRGAWRYRIPDAPDERRHLRELCQRTLAFENHFLTVYKTYLLGELRSTNAAARRQALDVLARLPFADADVLAVERSTADA
jgi:hypothetical protein